MTRAAASTGTMLFDFMLAAWGGKTGELAETIRKFPDAVRWRDEAGGTALRKAVAHGSPHLDAVTLLLDKGADINARDKEGMTALMFAALHQEQDCAALLLSRGAGAHLEAKDGRTAMDFARQSGCKGIVDLLAGHAAARRARVENRDRRQLESAAARMHRGLTQPLKVRRPVALRPGFRP